MKSDYNKSMLRLGAVVVASASIFGAASSMKAAPVAAPVYADEDVTEPSEEDQANLQEENQMAFEAEYAKLIAMQEKLTDVLKSAEENYSAKLPEAYDAALEAAMAIQTKINGFMTAADNELEEANEAGRAYVPVISDTDEEMLDSDIDEILYNLDQKRIAQNDEVYGNYMTALSLLQEKLTAVTNTTEPWGRFVDQKKAEGVYNELNALYEDAEKEYQATQEAGWFELSIADDEVAMEGAIQTLEEKAQQAYEAWRVEANAAAYNNIMDQINALQEKFDDATAEDNDYYPYINRGAKESIQNEIDALKDDANAEKRATAEVGEFGLNIDDSVIEIEAAIEDLRTKAGNAYEKVRKANNEANYNKCMDAIEALRTEFEEATAEDNDYAKFLNRGQVESIESEIGILEDDVNAEKRATEEVGEFSLTIDDSVEAIRDMINKVVDNAKKALEKERVELNTAAYDAVMAQIEDLRTKLAEATAEDNKYAPYLNRGVVESIENEIGLLEDDANAEKRATDEAGYFSLNIDDSVSQIEGAINDLVEKAAQAYEKVRVENNAAAYDAVMAQIDDLRNKLAEAIAEDNDYAPYLNRGLVESIENEIGLLEDDANAEKRATEEAGEFSLNIDDSVSQIEGAINGLVEKAAQAYEAERVKNNAIAWGNYMKNINDLLSAWDDAFADTTTDYYTYLNRGVVESIYNEIELLKTDGEDYWRSVQEAGVFDLNIDDEYNTIMGAINAAVEKAQQAYEAWRVAYNEDAYGKYMQTLSDLQDELTSQCAVESLEYYKYINRGKVEAIYNELETLHDEAEKYYEGVKEAGVFDLSIDDDAAMIRGQIKAIVDAAKAIADNPRAYENAEAYGNDMTRLFEMQQDFTALWESLQQTSPEFYESEYGLALAQGVYQILSDANDAVEAEYAAVAEEGYYVSPLTEAFDQDFEDGVANLQHMAQVFADNHAAMMVDQDKVNALDDEVFELGDELDAIDPEWMENEEAEALGNEIRAAINNLRTEIEGAYAASMKTAEYVSPITEEDLADVKAMMDDLRDLVKANVENNRVAMNDAAYGADSTRLTMMHQDFTALWEELGKTSPDFYDSAYGQALAQNVYQILADANEAVYAAYAAVAEEGYYVSPLTEAFDQDFEDGVANLQHMAQVFADNNAAMMADQDKVNALDDEVFELGDKLDALDPEWMEIEEAAALGDEIRAMVEALRAEILGAYQASLKTGEYISPIDEESFADVRTAMDDLYKLVQAKVAANLKAYNDAAFGAEFSLLVSLQEQLSNTWNEILEVYPGFEDFGAAIALRTNLYNELSAKADACEAEYDAVAEEGTYSPQLPYTFEQEILDGIEQLLFYAEQYGTAWDEFQANAAEAEAINSEWFPFLDELDSIYAEWMDNEEAFALYEELSAANDAFLNDCSGAWQAFLKTGEYIAPFDQQDIDDFRAKMEELRNLVIETGVATISELDADAEFYTIDGQKLSRPVRGMVNIVRTGDKVQKIFIK